MKPRIAIACQGGGSQTAFTAGALKALFENKVQDPQNLIADRRNELEGNLSLFQSLGEVEDINTIFLRGGFRDEFLAEVDVKEPIKIPKLFPEDPDQPYHIPMIETSEDLEKSLDLQKSKKSPFFPSWEG